MAALGLVLLAVVVRYGLWRWLRECRGKPGRLYAVSVVMIIAGIVGLVVGVFPVLALPAALAGLVLRVKPHRVQAALTAGDAA